MRYFLFLALALGLAACDPSDVVDVDINPSQAVEDAVDGVQQGVDGLNDAVQNFGGEEGANDQGSENRSDNENEAN